MAPKNGVRGFISAKELHMQSDSQQAPRSGTPPTKSSIKAENSGSFENMASIPVNERRRMIAEKARVQVPITKTDYNSNKVAQIKPENQKMSTSMAPPMLIKDTMHIEDEHWPNRFYDTEYEETSTLSHELQTDQTQIDENGHGFAESRFDQQQRDQAPQAPDPGNRYHVYDQASHDRDYHMDGRDEGNEEGTEGELEDDSDSEGYAAEDDPTMDSVKMNSAISHGLVSQSERDEYKDFVKNQSIQLNGMTSSYPSTRSSEASLIPSLEAAGLYQYQQGSSQLLKYQSQNPSKILRQKSPEKQHENLSFHRHELPQIKNKAKQHYENTSQPQKMDTNQPLLLEEPPRNTIPLPIHERLQEIPRNSPSNQNQIEAEDLRPPPLNNIPCKSPENQSSTPSKRPLVLDYPPADLSKLSYSTLLSQPFEHDPHSAPPPLPSHLSTAPLTEQLSYMTFPPTTNPHNQQNPPTPNLSTFLSSLPIDQYEECGDLIIEQFSTILNKFKDVRRKKRDVARAFEDEIAKREADVRERREGVENEVGRLGSGVREVVMRRR